MFARSALVDGCRRLSFENELSALQCIECPNVIKCLHCAYQEAHVLLLFPYLQGGTVLEAVNEGGPVDYGPACLIVRDCVMGIHELHLKGWIHGDISANNIGLDRNGIAVILDLGCAYKEACRDSHQSSENLRFRGTLHSAAPELLEGERISKASDIYSIGVLMHELITGMQLIS